MRDFGGEKEERHNWEQAEKACFKKLISLTTDQKKLTWAIRGGHISLVKHLVNRNPSLVSTNSKKRIPIYVAAQTGNA